MLFRSHGIFNLNTFNSLHSFIKETYNHYHGVATKYINLYNSYFLLLFDVQKCEGYSAFLMNETKCVVLHIQAYNSFARLSLWIFTSNSKEFIHLARGRMYIVFLFSRRFVTLLWNNAIGRFIIVAAFKGKGKYFIAQRLFITASFMERILISWIQH